jgi:hypothetical protein
VIKCHNKNILILEGPLAYPQEQPGRLKTRISLTLNSKGRKDVPMGTPSLSLHHQYCQFFPDLKESKKV